jgi:hypothetical protein
VFFKEAYEKLLLSKFKLVRVNQYLTDKKIWENKMRELRNQHNQEVRRIFDRRTKKEQELDEIVGRLIRVATYPPQHALRTFRVQVDFEEEMVHQSFIHGDSQRQIQMVAESLARNVEAEILKMNFHRWNKEDERPRRNLWLVE